LAVVLACVVRRKQRHSRKVSFRVLDTNIFIYSFDPSAPAKARRALELIRQALTGGRGIISYQVVQEFLYVALRRFARPMSTGEAEE
jgi:predicted nucleic acid-binding protein